MPPQILVLYNEPVLPIDHPDAESEHDILETVDDTFKVLESAGFQTRRLGINFDPQPLLDELKRNPPDAVFNLFEGVPTRPGTEVSAAALLEWLNVPFTGCPAASLALGRDKIRTKHLLAGTGLPTAPYLIIDERPVPRWRRGWPAIVKPADQDASIGIDQGSVVKSQKELAQRVELVLEKFGPPVLVEKFIFGREFHVNMIEDGAAGTERPLLVLPLAEIAFRETPGRWPVYTFTAKWDMESDEYRTSPLVAPVEIEADAFERLRMIGEKAFRLLTCRDYARLDVRMAADGSFSILEVNPNPYLNSLALVNGLMALGRTHEQLLVELALAALARGGKKPSRSEIQVPVGIVTSL